MLGELHRNLLSDSPPSCSSPSSSFLSSVFLCPAPTPLSPSHLAHPPPMSVVPLGKAGLRARHTASIVTGGQRGGGLVVGQRAGSDQCFVF